MFLSNLLLVAFIGFVNARPGGFQAGFQNSGHIRFEAPAVPLTPVAPSASYSLPAPAKVAVSSAAVHAAPVRTSTSIRFQHDPQIFNRKAERVVGAISDIVNVLGNFVVGTIRDFPPPPKVVTTHHVQQPVAVIRAVSKEIF